MQVALIGATGFVGAAVLKELLQRGHQVVALVRDPAKLAAAAKAGTLATLIASYSSPEGLFWAKLSAASVMAIGPILILGWFSQKQLVRGLTFGAVK